MLGSDIPADLQGVNTYLMGTLMNMTNLPGKVTE